MQIGKFKFDNKSILAPMAGVGDSPFRCIVKELGCALVYSEMVSANGLMYGDKRTSEYLSFKDFERPLNIQTFGSNPKILADAARMLEDSGADMVDLNMGCPVKKVVNNGAGSALMRNTKNVHSILTEMRKALSVPFTVKIRSGWSKEEENALLIAEIASDCGVDAISVHPRFRSQAFSGSADWSIIRRVKEKVSCTVIGNGDVKSPIDASNMLKETGCDGIMIGRAAMGNPWIFREVDHYLNTGELISRPSIKEKFDVIFRHLDYSYECYGKRSVPIMRSHLSWYLKGLYGASSLRSKLFTITDFSCLKEMLQEYLEKITA